VQHRDFAILTTNASLHLDNVLTQLQTLFPLSRGIKILFKQHYVRDNRRVVSFSLLKYNVFVSAKALSNDIDTLQQQLYLFGDNATLDAFVYPIQAPNYRTPEYYPVVILSAMLLLATVPFCYIFVYQKTSAGNISLRAEYFILTGLCVMTVVAAHLRMIPPSEWGCQVRAISNFFTAALCSSLVVPIAASSFIFGACEKPFLSVVSNKKRLTCYLAIALFNTVCYHS
jgi:hypothetical protein